MINDNDDDDDDDDGDQCVHFESTAVMWYDTWVRVC